MKTGVFTWFDRAILGAIFIGIVMVGVGIIKALEAATEAVVLTREALEETKFVSSKADRNFNATTVTAELKRVADQVRGNATIGLFLPILLDILENSILEKHALGIPDGGPGDQWIIRFNGTHMNINNQTMILVPNIRQLLGATNASGNADVLGPSSNISIVR